MANILPVSDLRNYNEVLKNCHKGEPVHLWVIWEHAVKFVIANDKIWKQEKAIVYSDGHIISLFVVSETWGLRYEDGKWQNIWIVERKGHVAKRICCKNRNCREHDQWLEEEKDDAAKSDGDTADHRDRGKEDVRNIK